MSQNSEKSTGSYGLLTFITLFCLLFITTISPLEAARKTVGKPSKITNTLGMDFIKIPAGNFAMGCAGGVDSRSSTYCLKSEGPVRHVNIPKAFYMGRTEVTQGQWKKIMGKNPSYFKDCGADCPVENISWIEVQEFIAVVNKSGNGIYRLPTTAEWEYAARAGTTTAWSHGDQEGLLDEYAWSVRNAGTSVHQVGKKQPNPWGLYDMHGNVWEMTKELINGHKKIDEVTGEFRDSYALVIKGGDWECSSSHLRSAYVSHTTPTEKTYSTGFRLMRVDTPSTKSGYLVAKGLNLQ